MNLPFKMNDLNISKYLTLNNMIIAGLVVIILFLIGNYSNSNSKKGLEGFSNTKLNPAGIKESLNLLKNENEQITDGLLVNKYRSDYEDYIIELNNHIDLLALSESVKPEEDVKVKIESLKEIDTRYSPLKEMLNDVMKKLDKTT